LIEECMLAANVCAADFLETKKQPGLFRIHGTPSPEKLQGLRDPDNQTLKKLKEAVFWAIKQCDTWDQYS